MNRLSLQEMRNLLIKKGRLLYGAVFLFCLICLYGLYTSQWTRVSDLAADNGAPDSSSETVRLDAKEGRGGAVGQGKSEGTFVAPVISLAGVLRGHPLDDPFTHLLLNEDNTVIAGAPQMAQKGGPGKPGIGNSYGQTDTFNTSYVIGSNRGGRTNNYAEYSGNNYGRSGRSYTGGSDTQSKGSYGNRQHSMTDIKVTGIITGSTPMAILTNDDGEGCYGVGEGPRGVTVKQIADHAVLISGAGGSRWLYVE